MGDSQTMGWRCWKEIEDGTGWGEQDWWSKKGSRYAAPSRRSRPHTHAPAHAHAQRRLSAPQARPRCATATTESNPRRRHSSTAHPPPKPSPELCCNSRLPVHLSDAAGSPSVPPFPPHTRSRLRGSCHKKASTHACAGVATPSSIAALLLSY